jgi:hypothetical protein
MCLKTGKGKGKGKVYPRTGHEGPDGEQIYSSTLSLTLRLDRGGWSRPRLGRFNPGKDPVPIVGGWVDLRAGLDGCGDGCGKSRLHRDSMRLKTGVFWNVTPCSLVELYLRLRGSFYFHHQG